MNFYPNDRNLRFAAIATTTVSLLIGTAHPAAQAQSRELVEACNQFAEVVNRNQAILSAFEGDINTFSENAAAAETLDEMTIAATQYVDAVTEVTERLDSLSEDLEDLGLNDDQLSTYRDDYVEVVSGFSEALAIVREAMRTVAESESDAELSDNLKSVQAETVEAVSQIGAIAGDESDIISDVNGYCGTN